jgi:hypothetical protein
MVVVPASHRSTLVRKRGTLAEPRIHACNGSRDRVTSSRTLSTGVYKHHDGRASCAARYSNSPIHSRFPDQKTSMGESGSRADGIPTKMKALQ